jgi:DNA-binding NarL/FixJ family response regulator
MTVKIIIADDHAIVRRGLRMLLEAQPGWEVCRESGNGQTAVEQALAGQADIAILDYSLPVLNGLEATRQIRLAARAPRCCSIRCTTTRMSSGTC